MIVSSRDKLDAEGRGWSTGNVADKADGDARVFSVGDGGSSFAHALGTLENRVFRCVVTLTRRCNNCLYRREKCTLFAANTVRL